MWSLKDRNERANTKKTLCDWRSLEKTESCMSRSKLPWLLGPGFQRIDFPPSMRTTEEKVESVDILYIII